MKNNALLLEIYQTLLKAYGQQGWWPVTRRGRTVPEYHVPVHNRKQKLEIVFSAVLTQNTQWKPNAERAVAGLNRKNLIDANRILKAKHEELAQCIKSAGYYNQKAKKLKNVAEFLKRHPLKDLEATRPATARELLLSVNGIGPETADSILLYALDKPVFVVDAYTKRLLSRLGVETEARYESLQSVFMTSLEHDARMFNEFHALIVRHAKEHCRAKPVCRECPLSRICHYGVIKQL